MNIFKQQTLEKILKHVDHTLLTVAATSVERHRLMVRGFISMKPPQDGSMSLLKATAALSLCLKQLVNARWTD